MIHGIGRVTTCFVCGNYYMGSCAISVTNDLPMGLATGSRLLTCVTNFSGKKQIVVLLGL